MGSTNEMIPEPDSGTTPDTLLALADVADRSTQRELSGPALPPLTRGEPAGSPSFTLPPISHLNLDGRPAPTRTSSHRKTNSMSISLLLDRPEPTDPLPHPPLTPTTDRIVSRSPERTPYLPAVTAPLPAPPHDGPRLPALRAGGAPGAAVVGPHHPVLASHRRHQSWSVGQQQQHHPYSRARYAPSSRRDEILHSPTPAAPSSTVPAVPSGFRPLDKKLRPNMTHAFIAYMIYSDQVRTGIVQPKRAGQSYSPARSDVSVPSGFAPAAGSSPLARSGYGHSRSKTISAFHTSDPPVSHLEPPAGGYTHPSARHRDTRPADPAPSGQSLGLGGHFSHLGAAHARSVSYSSGPLSSLPNRYGGGPPEPPGPEFRAYPTEAPPGPYPPHSHSQSYSHPPPPSGHPSLPSLASHVNFNRDPSSHTNFSRP